MELKKKWSIKVLGSAFGAVALGGVIATTAAACDSIQAPGTSVDAISNVAGDEGTGSTTPTGTLQEALGTLVKQNAFDNKLTGTEQYGSADRQSKIKSTWVFAGGSDSYADWATFKTQKNFVQIFAENLKYQTADFSSAEGALSTTTRFAIDQSAPNQTLSSLLANFQTKIGQYDPKNVVYVIDSADVYDANFQQNLTALIKSVLALRNNTGTLSIVKHWKTGTDKDAGLALLGQQTDTVLQSLFANAATTDLVKRVNLVDASVLTAPRVESDYSQALATFQNDLAKLIYDTASGHYAGAANSTLEPASQYAYLQNGTASDFVNVTIPEGVSTSKMEFDRDYTGNGLDLSAVVRTTPTSGLPTNQFHSLKVTLPNAAQMAGKQVDVYIDFVNMDYHIKDSVTVGGDGTFVIQNVPYWYLTTADTAQGFEKHSIYDLTVVDTSTNKAYNPWRYTPKLSETQQASTPTTNQYRKALSVQQQLFMSKFDSDRPLSWVFLGSTPDTGYDPLGKGQTDGLGFTNYAETVSRAVKSTSTKRANDTFVDASMVGDFLSRASDSDLITTRVGSYNPDVIVLSYGLTERMSDISYAQLSPEKISTFSSTGAYAVASTEDQIKQKMLSFIDTLKAKYPNATILLNDVDASTDSVNGNRTMSFDNLVPQTSQYLNVFYNGNTDNVFEQRYNNYTWMSNDGFDFRQKSILGVNQALQKADDLFNTLGISNEYTTYLMDYRIDNFAAQNSGVTFDGGRWNTVTQYNTGVTHAPHAASQFFGIETFRKVWYAYSPNFSNLQQALNNAGKDPGQIRIELQNGTRTLAFNSQYGYGVMGYNLFGLNVDNHWVGFGPDMFVESGNYKITSVVATAKNVSNGSGYYYSVAVPSQNQLGLAPILGR